MLRRTLLFVVTAAVFALVGSQAARLHMAKIPHQGQKCKTTANDCKIKVMVDKWCFHCDVYVDFELTEVTVDQGVKDSTITWDIADPNYEFVQNDPNGQNGVVFPQSSGFTCQAQNKQKFTCTNVSTPGVYKYTINVKGLDPLDPWVVNN